MVVQPLDKQIATAVEIFKLLEKNKITFSEFPFINQIVCDSIKNQAETVEYETISNYMIGKKVRDSADVIIEYHCEDPDEDDED